MTYDTATPLSSIIDRHNLENRSLESVYNEDSHTLETVLRSLLEQSQVPQEIHVVDDGSTTSDYADICDHFTASARQKGVLVA